MVTCRNQKARIIEEQNVKGREQDMKLETSSQHNQELEPAGKILLINLGPMGSH